MIALCPAAVSALLALPSLVAAASFLRLGVESLRRLAVASAAVQLLATTVLAVAYGTAAFPPAAPGLPLFGLSALSNVLLPFAALLWLLTVGVTPRGALGRAGLRRTALASLVTFAFFLTRSPFLLAGLWAVSAFLLLDGLRGARHRYAFRIAAVHHGVSTLLFLGGAALLAFVPGAEALGSVLLAGAVLIRKGIFPVHAWVPEVIEHGRLGPAILFSAPQIGAYVAAVLIVPHAPDALLRTIALAALLTSVYGAMLALVQDSARRAVGYLFVSQSALVMAGLDCTSEQALAGGLCVWLTSGIAFAGLARCLLVLEARRGRLSLSALNGGYERMPMLAASFLILGLAAAGFPGTLGFVGEELLVGGAVEAFPVVGFSVVLAGALTGLAVLRMYFALFCGRRDPGIHLRPRRREIFAFAALALTLLFFGLAPSGIVASRAAAARELMELRRDRSCQVSAPCADTALR